MLKTKHLMLIALLLTAIAGTASAQDVVDMSTPKPTPKPLPKSTGELSDAEIQKQILQTFQTEDENWREFSYPDNYFKAVFPRTPVKQSMTFLEKGLGNPRLSIYFGAGDTGIYCIGQLRLPYPIREKAALQETYRGFVDGILAGEGFTEGKTTEIVFKGVSGVKVTGSFPNETPVEVRAIVIGKNLLYAMVIGGGPGRSPESPATISLADSERFLESFEVIPEKEAPAVAESPIFKSSVTDSVFSSDYFLFTLKASADWFFLVQSDVNDLRGISSSVAKPAATQRRNLFALTTKALGMERNSMLECNVVKTPSPRATTMQLAEATRVQYTRLGRYKTVSKPVSESVGGVGFVRIETSGETGSFPFKQKVYFVVRKGYVLIFIITAYDENDLEPLVNAFKSIKFRAK